MEDNWLTIIEKKHFLIFLKTMDQSHLSGPYLPWIGTAVAVAYAVYLTVKARGICGGGGGSTCDGKSCVNPTIRKEADKVVDSFDIEDLDKKAVFCRCWRSKKFPYCDGAHNGHNQTTGDNVGPLIIQKKVN
ncbi:CDGSH iron-sulfur domain-containing protein 2 homolog [Oppia nitens]|uniref:CDGSH iron-sulfur domain-containing protein 2 homolog n=1 Tax=Oppia nitens TaxID=1686743 RepID=UPI0023DBDFBF|nr:CDGSH iron-sulfur domain-containing protein 2 homolog [Oppia nitens]